MTVFPFNMYSADALCFLNVCGVTDKRFWHMPPTVPPWLCGRLWLAFPLDLPPGGAFWVGHFRRYGKQLREYLENAWGISSVVAPAFFTWVGIFRGYGRQLREYVVTMGEMCQHHGACVLNLGGKCS